MPAPDKEALRRELDPAGESDYLHVFNVPIPMTARFFSLLWRSARFGRGARIAGQAKNVGGKDQDFGRSERSCDRALRAVRWSI